MKIYLASGFSRRYYLRSVANDLERAGHEVVSRWIELESRPEEGDPRYELFLRTVGNKNLEDLERADCLIIDMKGVRAEGNGGAHTEVGYFLAKNKPIYLIGKPTNSFHHQSSVTILADYSDLIEILKQQ